MNTRTYQGYTEKDIPDVMARARASGRRSTKVTRFYHEDRRVVAAWQAGYLEVHGIDAWRELNNLSRCALDRPRL